MSEETPTGRPTMVKQQRPERMQTQESVKWRVAQTQDDRHAKEKAESAEGDKQ